MTEKSEWSKWYLQKSGIRRCRYVNGKQVWERHPKRKYRHLTSEAELKKYVAQLNHRFDQELAKAKAAYDFKHLFITDDVLEEFRSLLKSEIPNVNVHTSAFNYLKRHCLHWFITLRGLPDPIDWKEHEKQWGLALLGGLEKDREKLGIFEKKAHPDTISKHVQILNRFLRFLHTKMPKTVPAIVLEPISKAQMRFYSATYKQNEEPRGKYISDADWKRIEKELDPTIKAFVQVGYYYGLRLAECLAVSTENLFEDSFDVKEQLVGIPNGKPKFEPVKNRLARRVPHWFISPEKAYKILSNAPTLMHPDTFGDRFRGEMERLGFEYNLHDLRRTFITRAFRANKNPRDIMLAAGHADLETTMRYAQDDRDLSRKKFVPGG